VQRRRTAGARAASDPPPARARVCNTPATGPMLVCAKHTSPYPPPLALVVLRLGEQRHDAVRRAAQELLRPADRVADPRRHLAHRALLRVAQPQRGALAPRETAQQVVGDDAGQVVRLVDVRPRRQHPCLPPPMRARPVRRRPEHVLARILHRPPQQREKGLLHHVFGVLMRQPQPPRVAQEPRPELGIHLFERHRSTESPNPIEIRLGCIVFSHPHNAERHRRRPHPPRHP
jgi:hypothetical protein